MKRSSSLLRAPLAAMLLAAGIVHAQPAAPTAPAAATAPDTASTARPTTRILAIGTLDPGADPAAARAILPAEVRETVRLYLAGKIDQWYSLRGRVGVVFILDTTDTAAAHDMLGKLPLGQAHLMSFELMPLGPLEPLRVLRGM